MKQVETDNQLIIRPDGEDIADDVLDIIKYPLFIIGWEDIIQQEHPNCAFFKTTHRKGDKKLERSVLYTKSGRLHIDFEENEQGETVALDKYIDKKEQLDTLLFYLRDIVIKTKPFEHDEKRKVLIMPKSPLVEFADWVEDGLLHEVLDEHNITISHIFSVLGKLYNKKVQLLSDTLHDSIDYLVYDKIILENIDEKTFDRLHMHYIRKSRLFKQV